ncbi:MAG: hypothetical protein OXH09_03365 [Gammaproteobacteria bacterium]|nr:hypothetical protein [Gammaproteobacteria bacterium]
MRNYFRMIREAFASVRQVMNPDGRVVQIVGFSDIEDQLPAYLQAMEEAGFLGEHPVGLGDELPQRRVANRKWYATLKGDTDASREFMLVHRVRRG